MDLNEEQDHGRLHAMDDSDQYVLRPSNPLSEVRDAQ